MPKMYLLWKIPEKVKHFSKLYISILSTTAYVQCTYLIDLEILFCDFWKDAKASAQNTSVWSQVKLFFSNGHDNIKMEKNANS